MIEKDFFGSTTVGERGQIVIPAEAREKFDFKKGEKVLVFGIKDKGLFLAKIDAFKGISEKLKKHQELIDKIIKNS